MSTFRAAFWAAVLMFGAVAPSPGSSAQTDIFSTPWTELHASSRVRLVASRAATPEGRYLAGLDVVLADGWKTYWRMPGDSGVPPTFDWTGSTNVATAKVLYPAPMRMPEAGGAAIGYKHAVLLPVEITPQTPGKPVILKLALEFGICREICIPATANFELSIPPAPAGAPAGEIVDALQRVPRPQQGRRKTDPDLKRIMVTRDGSSPKLAIEASFAGDGNGGDVFIEAPEGLYVPMPSRVTPQGSAVVRFETKLAPDLVQDLKGKTLRLTLVSEAGATEAQWVFP